MLVRNECLARSIPWAANLELDVLPPVSLPARLRFTYFEAARLAEGWEADLFFSAAECAPLRAACPKYLQPWARKCPILSTPTM